MRRGLLYAAMIPILFWCILAAAAGATDRLPPPDFPLMEAVKKGDAKNVRSLLESASFNKADIDRKGISGETALTVAAGDGNLEIVQLLVEHGAAVDAGKDGARTPLIEASGQGYVKVVQYLIEKGADVNARGGGITALLAASRNDVFPFKPKGNRKRTMASLLSAGADVNVQDESWMKTGRTPLMFAVTQGDAAAVQSFLAKGAKLDVKDSNGDTAMAIAKKARLEYIVSLLEKAEKGPIEAPPAGPELPPIFDAVRENSLSKVKALLKGGEDVDRRTPSGSTPLMFAADGGNAEIARYLIKEGADVNAGNGMNNTALIFAATKGHANIAADLLRKKADVNARNLSRGDALIYAVIHNKADVVRILLKSGADIDRTYDDGKTALIAAVAEGNEGIARQLIARGAEIDAADRNGVTALMVASIKGQAEMVDAFIKAGADVHIKDKNGETALDKAVAANRLPIVKRLADAAGRTGREQALFAAAGNGNMEIVKLLLTRGVDVNSAGPGGETLLMRAAAADDDMVKYLVGKHADVNSRDYEGNTALIKAAGSFYSTADVTVRYLLENSADPNAANKDGETALILAAKRGRTVMAETLLAKGAAVFPKDKAGKTALVYAMEGGYNDIAARLTKAGAARDYKGMKWSAFVSKQKEPFIKVVDNAQEWHALWRRAIEKTAPDIDFDKYVVACVFLGYYAKWLYAINIGEPVMEDGRMVVPYGLLDIELRLSGPFEASGQYAMKVLEKKPGVSYVVEERPARTRRHPPALR